MHRARDVRLDARCLDVLIVGAGISGLGAAYYLQREHPRKKYAILEARGSIGGTWDLFRYPGIRSDSDLHTFGYEFRPWRDEDSIAGADKILAYLRETAGASAGGGGGSADELAKLADLRDRGVITADEFASQKAKILA